MLQPWPCVFVAFDPDTNPVEEEEKQRLIRQVLELQNTLDGKKRWLWLQRIVQQLFITVFHKYVLSKQTRVITFFNISLMETRDASVYQYIKFLPKNLQGIICM